MWNFKCFYGKWNRLGLFALNLLAASAYGQESKPAINQPEYLESLRQTSLFLWPGAASQTGVSPQGNLQAGSIDPAVIQPAVHAAVQLMNQAKAQDAASDASEAPRTQEGVQDKDLMDIVLSIVERGKSMGMRFSGLTIGRFKGGSVGISGQIGKEIVFAPDSKNPGVWNVAVYSTSSYGVGLAAQVGAGISVGVIFDMPDIEAYKKGFCAATGLFGNFVEVGISFRTSCGVRDFVNLTKAYVERKKESGEDDVKKGEEAIQAIEARELNETRVPVVQVSEKTATLADQKAFLDEVAQMFGDRPKVIGASIALGGGLPLGVVFSYQPHKQVQKPAPLDMDSIEQLINQELL